jgi:lipopolysaccharide/colanic/teichoic acid biosynthesis glycosyltransferase
MSRSSLDALSIGRVIHEVARRPRLRRFPPPRATAGPFLGETLFKEALARERRRADRFDQHFAVIVLDGGGSSPSSHRWNAILRAVTSIKRNCDTVGWLEKGNVLALVLPKATATGGLEVLRRLQDAAVRRIGEGALAALSMRLYAHRARTAEDGSTVPSVDLLLEAFIPERRHLWRDGTKRALDIIGSIVLLAMFSPLLLAAAALVRLTSPGPALFRQVRVGRRGVPFTMLKFRTMYADAGHAIHQDYVTWFIKSSRQQPTGGTEVFKLTDDPRITRVGHLLRRTSLDELPQFWNVLRGEMSLVGPRPPLPFEVEQYQPWHRRRVLEAKPGVTGPWQVFGRSRTTFDDMVRLDLRYARTHSLWTDIKILAATPAAMISGKGAC